MTRREILKVMTVFGTRPEAIKMAPVVRALEARPDRVESVVSVTAQHRGMLDQILSAFGVVPRHDLDLMTHDQSPAALAGRVLEGMSRVLEAERPDWVLVQGDTTTTAAAALGAFYLGMRVGHVEAGLRTFDRLRPFPEEINRRVTSVVADLHFAPTDRARRNLLAEGIEEDRVLTTGNTVVDALRIASGMPFDPAGTPLAGLPADRRVVLLTAHRRENFGEPLRRIFEAVRRIAEEWPRDVHFVIPVHPNPSVRSVAHEMLGTLAEATLTEPLDYLALVHVMKRASLILTDSGGIQEEAPYLGVPTLVLREKTERPEALESGTVRLVGTGTEKIRNAASDVLRDASLRETMARKSSPYGDGYAAQRIVEALLGSGARR